MQSDPRIIIIKKMSAGDDIGIISILCFFIRILLENIIEIKNKVYIKKCSKVRMRRIQKKKKPFRKLQSNIQIHIYIFKVQTMALGKGITSQAQQSGSKPPLDDNTARP